MNKYKEARQTKGYTIQETSIKLDMSINGYKNIENGVTKNIKSENLEKLKKVLGV